MDHLCYLCLVFVKPLRLLIAALWSPAGKGLTSWLSSVMFNCVFVTFPCGILGQVWYLIESILDLCRLLYFFCTCDSGVAPCQLITTPVSLLANEFDFRHVLHGKVSLAADNQMCVIQEAMKGCKNPKIH